MEREKQLLERIATLEAEVSCLKEFISQFDIKQISGNLVINITNPQEDLQLTGAENGDIYVSLAEVHGTIARK